MHFSHCESCRIRLVLLNMSFSACFSANWTRLTGKMNPRPSVGRCSQLTLALGAGTDLFLERPGDGFSSRWCCNHFYRAFICVSCRVWSAARFAWEAMSRCYCNRIILTQPCPLFSASCLRQAAASGQSTYSSSSAALHLQAFTCLALHRAALIVHADYHCCLEF